MVFFDNSIIPYHVRGYSIFLKKKCRIYAAFGVLQTPIVTEYMGGTAKQTHAMVQKAMGGVLFIDEAYSICRESRDFFGKEAIDTLTADIYNYREDLLVILAGYDSEMEYFLSQNPGMKSRIPTKIHFENYSSEELMQILQKYIDESGMFLNPDAEKDAKELLEDRSKATDFGNARGVENLFNEVVKNHQKRLASTESEYISVNDIKILRREDFINPDELMQKQNTVQEWYEELDSLTGLESVKLQVKQMIAKVKVNKVRKERGLPTQDIPALHTLFKGNAGTGKTTVARLIGHIYYGLGILPTSKVVECTRSDVVGEYMGHTAKRMKEKINEAQGGILFIDEVYSLCNGAFDEFGLEAINELVPAMENQRDNFMVIAAGYTDQVDDFMKTNQGLKSRFSTEIIFEDYTAEELMEIFEDMLDERFLVLISDNDTTKTVETLIRTCSLKKDFGNARGIRNLVEQLSQIQECRIAKFLENGQNLSDEAIQRIVKEDLDVLINRV